MEDEVQVQEVMGPPCPEVVSVVYGLEGVYILTNP